MQIEISRCDLLNTLRFNKFSFAFGVVPCGFWRFFAIRLPYGVAYAVLTFVRVMAHAHPCRTASQALTRWEKSRGYSVLYVCCLFGIGLLRWRATS